ncbi:MAG: DegV family protein [Aeromicrobium sp.]|uniref:DegV family protein n=1 Tax=Aeromicrobium sp. TaxID=1871063 RepID=UPI0039E25632
MAKRRTRFPGGVAVVTDSTASLSPQDAEDEGVEVVPLSVIVGADTLVEGVDADADLIASALRDFVPVSTSRPNPEEFAQVYRRLVDEGAKAIVSVHLSSRMSGTVDAAILAGRDVSVPVTVVDSRQVGVATGFATGIAARARGSKVKAGKVATLAREAGEASTTLIYVDTLEYLRRGGRVGAAAALIGSALAVKPLLTIRDGLVVPLEKVRTAGKAIARMETLAAEAAEQHASYDIGVQHLANEPVATQLAERLAKRLERETVPVDEVGAVIGAHVGPGTVAVTVTPRPV